MKKEKNLLFELLSNHLFGSTLFFHYNKQICKTNNNSDNKLTGHSALQINKSDFVSWSRYYAVKHSSWNLTLNGSTWLDALEKWAFP